MPKVQSTSQPIYGNYHGYYSKRPMNEDSRLDLVPTSLFRGGRVLDIGCNEGWITCQIAQSKGACKVVGVDIDETLVRDAWKRRRSVWSAQEPDNAVHTTSTDHENAASSDEPSRKKRRVGPQDTIQTNLNENAFEADDRESDYFPSSCEHMFGPLPILPKKDTTKFPHNVVFHAADWVNSTIPEDGEGYDVVVAFSVSKWIHLNGGDEGLMRFFNRIYEVLKPGGTFVFEPQEWDGYHKAKRLNQTLKENGNKLQLRPENFESILTEIGFSPPEHLGCPGEGGFKRSIDLYRKSL